MDWKGRISVVVVTLLKTYIHKTSKLVAEEKRSTGLGKQGRDDGEGDCRLKFPASCWSPGGRRC